ncbi:hypothetical protein O181_095243 [Austropuccinia psidii MF-1]|uniref:Uncharacterized protein n=1 Tax=Austropuccinia psidii MF-1 TaxID=1389203 RepID=A0A9Q3PB03_9BASI|nr:hypothetical protein [Austropuccinia psidii MF-1]
MNISSLAKSGSNSLNLKRKDIQIDENPGTAKKYKLTIREKSKSSASELSYSATERIQKWKERKIKRSSQSPKHKAIYKTSCTIHTMKQEVLNTLESSHSQSLSELRMS